MRHVRAPAPIFFSLGLLLAGAPQSAAQQIAQQFDVMVPMRDGIRLAADMWRPHGGGTFPTVLMRTPYLKAAERYPKLGKLYAEHGYAFVVQDARGRGNSDGDFDFFFADGEDGYDTIEWLAAQPWSNGKVGMVGGSYLATVQWLAALEDPPHLTCIIPQAPAGRYLEEIPAVGGAFMMQWALSWINGTSGRMGQGNATNLDWDKIYQHRPLLTMDSVMGRVMPLYRDFLTNPVMNDYWKRIQFFEKDFQAVDIPALTFTGWFDGDQPGALYYWRGMRAYSPGRDGQHVIIGPWTHGGAIRGGSEELGDMKFAPESVVDVDKLHLQWFDYCLKGESESFDFPRARVYITGSEEWHDFTDYPPPDVVGQTLYLHSGGSANTLNGDGVLSWQEPGNEPPDHFTFDPKDPVPAGIEGQALGLDHRTIERRDDVLVYTSEPLPNSVTVVGNIKVNLFAATDARDTDFTAKILDVYPDGRAIKLGAKAAGVIRARYRNGLDREELVPPGESQEYEIELYDIGHSFLPGHSIRIEISSSAYPYVNPNQNTGNPVATDTDWRVAHQIIYHDLERATRIILPVLKPRPVFDEGDVDREGGDR